MTTRIAMNDIPAPIFESMYKGEETLKGSPLDKPLLCLINLYVSGLNQCEFCIDMHLKEARKERVEEQKLCNINIWQDTTYFNGQEIAALSWAAYITTLDKKFFPDTLFEQLKGHFNEEQIAFLTFAINQINSWNRLMKGFGIPA